MIFFSLFLFRFGCSQNYATWFSKGCIHFETNKRTQNSSGTKEWGSRRRHPMKFVPRNLRGSSLPSVPWQSFSFHLQCSISKPVPPPSPLPPPCLQRCHVWPLISRFFSSLQSRRVFLFFLLLFLLLSFFFSFLVILRLSSLPFSVKMSLVQTNSIPEEKNRVFFSLFYPMCFQAGLFCVCARVCNNN